MIQRLHLQKIFFSSKSRLWNNFLNRVVVMIPLFRMRISIPLISYCSSMELCSSGTNQTEVIVIGAWRNQVQYNADVISIVSFSDVGKQIPDLLIR